VILAAAFLAFAGQTLVCHAENAGLLKCAHEVTPDGGATPKSSGDSSNESTPSGCKHAGCHKPVVAPQLVLSALWSPDFRSATYPMAVQILPDSPVAEIEYPPQLS
jgi:hypothetical protein